MERIKIFAAAHKPVVSYGDSFYQFVHVGAALHNNTRIENSINDDGDPDNISSKNGIYCELTGLYYIWKHVKNVEYTGLVHYRRFLAKK